MPQERVHQQVDVIVEHVQHVGTELKRLFLVENMCDTVKVIGIVFILYVFYLFFLCTFFRVGNL